jgi:hypothetical protein
VGIVGEAVGEEGEGPDEGMGSRVGSTGRSLVMTLERVGKRERMTVLSKRWSSPSLMRRSSRES